MPNWMTPIEAMNYFGVGLEELEDIVADYDVDVDLDDETDELIAIDADDCKEVLFKEHEKKVGHRPDDYRQVERARRDQVARDEREKQVREDKKSKLTERVIMRRGE